MKTTLTQAYAIFSLTFPMVTLTAVPKTATQNRGSTLSSFKMADYDYQKLSSFHASNGIWSLPEMICKQDYN